MNSSKPFYFQTSFFKNFLLMTGGGVSLIVLVILTSIWRTGSSFVQGFNTFLNPTITAPKVDVSNLVLKQIQDVSELTTTIFVMDAVVPASSERKISNVVVGESKLLYIARGEVRGGIDLSQLDNEDIKIVENGIIIQLPAPQIIDSKIDVKKSQVYDYSRGFLNLGPNIPNELQTQAQRESLNKIINTACNQGILNQANERAKLTITQLLQTTGYDNIEVKTTPSNGC